MPRLCPLSFQPWISSSTSLVNPRQALHTSSGIRCAPKSPSLGFAARTFGWCITLAGETLKEPVAGLCRVDVWMVHHLGRRSLQNAGLPQAKRICDHRALAALDALAEIVAGLRPDHHVVRHLGDRC